MAGFALKFPPELWSLLHSCETACVVECCGREAFDFSPANFALWMMSKDGAAARALVRAQLADLARELEAVRVQVDSADMNAYWPPGGALLFVKRLQETFESALKSAFPEES